MIAFHVTDYRFIKKFTLNHIGRKGGVGGQLIGPGVYFGVNSNSINIWSRGMSNPIVYVCDLSISKENTYFPFTKKPKEIKTKLYNKYKQILNEKNIEEIFPDLFDDGFGVIGGISHIVGNRMAIRIFKRIGIDATIESNNGKIKQICVFNMDVIKIIDKLSVDEIFS